MVPSEVVKVPHHRKRKSETPVIDQTEIISKKRKRKSEGDELYKKPKPTTKKPNGRKSSHAPKADADMKLIAELQYREARPATRGSADGPLLELQPKRRTKKTSNPILPSDDITQSVPEIEQPKSLSELPTILPPPIPSTVLPIEAPGIFSAASITAESQREFERFQELYKLSKEHDALASQLQVLSIRGEYEQKLKESEIGRRQAEHEAEEAKRRLAEVLKVQSPVVEQPLVEELEHLRIKASAYEKQAGKLRSENELLKKICEKKTQELLEPKNFELILLRKEIAECKLKLAAINGFEAVDEFDEEEEERWVDEDSMGDVDLDISNEPQSLSD